MSNQQNDIINEDRHERDQEDDCSICNNQLEWADISANNAVRSGRNDICRVCRWDLAGKRLKALEKRNREMKEANRLTF